MTTAYDAKKIKIRAIRNDVILTDMNFGETVTSTGIVLRSDDAKSHGVHPRWARVYAVGPEQQDVKVGQWVLMEHGRWTRGSKIDDGEGEKIICRADVNGMMLVSDEKPGPEDLIIGNSI
jgi:co-chaperonin GroES (HSP10)